MTNHKTTQRVSLGVGLLALFCLSAGPAPDLKRADGNFEKQLFQEALGDYVVLAASASGEPRWKALFRAVESEALLFRYLEATERVLKAPLPDDSLWKARFLILRAEMARHVLDQYGTPQVRGREQGSTDLARRTEGQWREEIEKSYQALWEMRKTLFDRPLSEETYFFETEKHDLEAIPTLGDLVGTRWVDYLLSQREDEGPKPQAEIFFAKSFDSSVKTGAPAPTRAAAILGEMAERGGEKRAYAREAAIVKRLLIPFRHSYAVKSLRDDKPLKSKAASLLKDRYSNFSSKRAKADAAHEAAQLFNQLEKYSEAVSLCRDAEKLSGTFGAEACSRLRVEIETPRLAISTRPSLPNDKRAVELTARNLNAVYFRAYRTSPDELKDLSGDRANHEWHFLRRLRDETIRTVLSRNSLSGWKAPLKPQFPHQPITTREVALPSLSPGLYVLVASASEDFTPRTALMNAAILNVTKLFTWGSVGLAQDLGVSAPASPLSIDAYHLHALDGETGLPVAGAQIQGFARAGWGKATPRDGRTGELGRASFQATIGRTDYYQSFDYLARQGENLAFASGPLNFFHSFPPRFQLFVETDRPVYRPGQKVRAKITVLTRTSQGFEVTRNHPFEILAADAGGNSFFKLKLRTNELGSAATDLRLPTGRLLGAYTLTASFREGKDRFSDGSSFQVEEYKRPEFEVTLKEATGAWKFGKSVTVEGSAKYYFGGAVPNAVLHYRVMREAFLPYFCWWWSWRRPALERVEVADGDVRANAQGDFSLSFVPESADESDDPLPARFTIEVDGRDAGGRTITASRVYSAGPAGLLFDVKFPAAFLTAGEKTNVEIRGVNLMEQNLASQGSFHVHQLGEPVDPSEKEPSPIGHRGLQEIYRDTKNGKEISQGEFKTTPKKAASLPLVAMDPGVYRLTLESKDIWGTKVEQSAVFVVAPKAAGTTQLKLSAVSLAEHPDYWLGETARALIGSSRLKGKMYVEYWQGYRLAKTELVDAGVRVVPVKIEDSHKGGVTLRWFGIESGSWTSGEARIEVPRRDQQLKLTFEPREAVEPGAKIAWDFKVTDFRGKPIDGEATVRVYDRSLEYYAAKRGGWGTGLFPPRPSPQPATDSVFLLYGSGMFVEPSILEKIFGISPALPYEYRHLPAPGLRSAHSRVSYSNFALGESSESSGRMSKTARSAVPVDRVEAPQADAPAEKEARHAETPPPVRSQFNETAHFAPQVRVRKGVGTTSFQMPDQLTSWRADIAALTAQAAYGETEALVQTRKDLIARIDMPRFFREGDKGEIAVLVHNETDSAKKVSVRLFLSEDGKGAESVFSIQDLERNVSVPSKGVAPLRWRLVVPQGTRTIKVRTLARAGALADAEEREILVLPSRNRFVAGTVVALDGNSNGRLEPPKLTASDHLEIQVLQVDPQLILPILNSIPKLIDSPHECTDSILNRYVPLAMVKALFDKNPKLAQMAKRIPRRKTERREWEQSDPRRQMQLLETPWQPASRGGSTEIPLIDVLDETTVARAQAKALERLTALQLSSGAFPWFSGGHDDPYMTLYVLAGFAEAADLGVKSPEKLVRPAFQYVLRNLKLSPDDGSLAFSLYAAYVMSSYLERYDWAKDARARVVGWLEHADQNSRALTALGKAYAAMAYHRLGSEEKSQAYLDRALDGAREDAVVGVHWVPEKLSWLWYRETITSHAFLIRAVTKLRPKDPRLGGMVKWLLFNRKGNEWSSTKAAAAAVHALVDFMSARGALTKPERFDVTWGDKTYRTEVAADAWPKSPVRWQRNKASATASVKKLGPGLAFASLTTLFASEDPPQVSGDKLLDVKRQIFLVAKQGKEAILQPLETNARLKVGDVLEIALSLSSRSQFEYVHLRSPRAAGFEEETRTSGWQWETLARYQEPRDSLTNFYLPWIPQGEYVLRYRVRATTPGTYRFLSAQVQSLYSPDVASYTTSLALTIDPEGR